MERPPLDTTPTLSFSEDTNPNVPPKEEKKPHHLRDQLKKKLHRSSSLLRLSRKKADTGKSGYAADYHPEEDAIPQKRMEQALTAAKSSREGLSAQEAKDRLDKFGPNELREMKKNPILHFLSFMWNPLSWAMEAAAIIAIILVDYIDFLLILLLLLINASIGFYEERESGSAIAALKAQLTPTCKALRDGNVQSIDSTTLVVGDIVNLRLGDVIPADCVLVGDSSLKVDQSTITGESLPVGKGPGDFVYSGSTAKMGETRGVVVATGEGTFFGKAATLMGSTEPSGHFRRVLRDIGLFCISLISVAVVTTLIIQLSRGQPCTSVSEGDCTAVHNILVFIAGGIPIAMPTVLSVTLAIGAGQLAAKKAIVTHVTAVEEMAGMDILCSDKTGTLTLNHLKAQEPVPLGTQTPREILFQAALAANPDSGDAIDIVVLEELQEAERELIKSHELLFFHPFDPVGKKTFAKLRTPQGETIHVAKGAPQVMLNESSNKAEVQERVNALIIDLAKRGYRTIGVAVSDAEGEHWEMTGLIPLFDPPREDTQETLRKCKELGVSAKMITGDQLAIAKETASLLGMGVNFLSTEVLEQRSIEGVRSDDLIVAADGFAQVFPEHKYEIVKRLEDTHHVVGMTGDGVNDAPALKRANIGIAVHGATDAARAASDIVLLTPGLSVIVDAIIGSRKIFQRMKNYCMYSLATTVRIVITFWILTVVWNFYFPILGIVLLALINDGCMLSVSKDRVKPSNTPDHWDLRELFGVSSILGFWLSISTITFFSLIIESSFFEDNFGLRSLDFTTIRGVLYLQVSLGGLATIFVTRSQRFAFMERPGTLLLFAFLFAQAAASILGAYGLGGFPFNGVTDWGGSGWGWVAAAWIWCIIWFLPMDLIKMGSRRLLRRKRETKVSGNKVQAKQQIGTTPFQTPRPSVSQEPSLPG